MHNNSQQNAGHGGCFCYYIVWILDETTWKQGVLLKTFQLPRKVSKKAEGASFCYEKSVL